jgi:hypothetical protein
VVFLLDHKFCYFIESYEVGEQVILLDEDMSMVLSHEAEITQVILPVTPVSSNKNNKRKATPTTDSSRSSMIDIINDDEVFLTRYRVSYMSYPNCVAYGGRQGRAVTGTPVHKVVLQRQLRKTPHQLPQFIPSSQYNYCPSSLFNGKPCCPPWICMFV